MSDCVLESEAGSTQRQNMIQKARDLGLKMRPREMQYCDFHRNNHIIEITDADVVDSRYGQAPVDVPVKSEPDVYIKRNYCSVCYAYHGGEEKCAGERPPAPDWSKKEIL